MRIIREGVHRAASVTGSLVGRRPIEEGDMQFDDDDDKNHFYDTNQNEFHWH